MSDDKTPNTEGHSEDSIFEKVLKGKVRQVVSELKMPKEALHYIFKQVDETKHAAVKIIATEVRSLLENTDLAEEAKKVLTSLSFEITTNIRFVPNEDGKNKRVKFKLNSDKAETEPRTVSGSEIIPPDHNETSAKES